MNFAKKTFIVLDKAVVDGGFIHRHPLAKGQLNLQPFDQLPLVLLLCEHNHESKWMWRMMMSLRLGGGDVVTSRGRQHCVEEDDDGLGVSLILLGLLV